MLEIIKSNFNRTIKSMVVIMIIFCMVIISFVWMVNSERDKLNRPFIGYDYYNTISNIPQRVFHEEHLISAPDFYNTMFISEVNEIKLNSAYENNDIKEITRLEAFTHLMTIRFMSTNSSVAPRFRNDALSTWNDVSGGISYDSMVFDDGNDQGHEDPYYANFLLHAKYYNYLYKNDMTPIFSDDGNNINYILYYFYNMFPYLILIAVILLWYNSINREKSVGSLKLILTQSVSRNKYYFSKWLAGVFSLTSIFILPLIIISLMMGIKNGFASLMYPISVNGKTWSSFIPLKISRHYGAETVLVDHTAAPQGMALVPFYQYLLSLLVVSILFIAFAVALTQLISALINSERLSIVVTGSVFALTIALSQLGISKFGLNLAPTALYNISKTVRGLQYVTALGASLILIVSTVLVLGIGLKYFNKKHI